VLGLYAVFQIPVIETTEDGESVIRTRGHLNLAPASV
jgi:hypothetical protein